MAQWFLGINLDLVTKVLPLEEDEEDDSPDRELGGRYGFYTAGSDLPIMITRLSQDEYTYALPRAIVPANPGAELITLRCYNPGPASTEVQPIIAWVLPETSAEPALPICPNGYQRDSASHEGAVVMVLVRATPGGELWERNDVSSAYENLQHAKLEFERRWQLNQEGIYATETAEDEERRRIGTEQAKKVLAQFRANVAQNQTDET